MRRIQTGLDEVLAFWLGDERLKLRRRERVYKASLRNDKQQNLRARQRRELIRFLHDT